MLASTEFPSIDNIVGWPAILFEDTPYALNKIGLISLISLAVPALLFLVAGAQAKSSLVPKGIGNVADATLDFVENQIARPGVGSDAAKYLPLLMSIFCFVFVGNIFEVLPTAHMPANARMANPVVLALVAWAMFIGAGLKNNGLGYFKSVLFPSGVPPALYLLVTPIEFISTFLVRPFSLAVRLFANMLAGHILLVTFAWLSLSLLAASSFALKVVSVAPFAGLVAFTGFEVMVAFLQAYIFALLTSVFIGGAIHPDH